MIQALESRRNDPDERIRRRVRKTLAHYRRTGPAPRRLLLPLPAEAMDDTTTVFKSPSASAAVLASPPSAASTPQPGKGGIGRWP